MMGVELFIHRQGAAESEYFSMTGVTGWQTVWLPAAVELGLDLIPHLGDGAFSRVPPDQLSAVSEQLARLKDWMVEHGHELYVEHLDRILAALATVRPGTDEVSFG